MVAMAKCVNLGLRPAHIAPAGQYRRHVQCRAVSKPLKDAAAAGSGALLAGLLLAQPAYAGLIFI